MAVAAYALSPIDLIPDFIPIVGYLDDMVVVPLGLLLVIWMMPADLMEEYRKMAREAEGKPVSRVAAAIIVLVWILSALLFAVWLMGSRP